jgi:hypothetical protein
LGCGGRLKVIASIEQPNVIERILAHLGERGPPGGRAGLQVRVRTRSAHIGLSARPQPPPKRPYDSLPQLRVLTGSQPSFRVLVGRWTIGRPEDHIHDRKG